MSDETMESRKHGDHLLTTVLVQIITLSVAAAGFLVWSIQEDCSMRGARWIHDFAFGGFLATILLALIGQIAVVVEAYNEEPKFPTLRRWLPLPWCVRNPQSWFYLCWFAFIVSGGFFAILVFQN